ncbi:hypothetical protein TNCV_3683881 [Trichonephila clavipes]|nr:hypothetical protein TNCV_3683881 [Trichonephila clavipes]
MTGLPQEPSFNRTVFPHTQHVFTELPPIHFHSSLAFSIPRFVTDLGYLGSFRMANWTTYEFRRIKCEFSATVEQDDTGHHTGLEFLEV